MTTLYLDKEQFETGGEICEGEEEDSYPNHEPCYITTTFISATFNPSKMFYDTLEISDRLESKIKDQGHVYLGVVFYSDGDTFGTTYGYYKLVGVSDTLKGVEKLNQKALQDGIDDHGYIHKPWEQYFAGLIGCEIFKLDIIE